MIRDTTAPKVSPRLIENIIIVAPIECSVVAFGQCIIAKLEENPLLIVIVIITVVVLVVLVVLLLLVVVALP